MTLRYLLLVLTALLIFVFVSAPRTQLNAAAFQIERLQQLDTIDASTVVPNQLTIGIRPGTHNLAMSNLGVTATSFSDEPVLLLVEPNINDTLSPDQWAFKAIRAAQSEYLLQTQVGQRVVESPPVVYEESVYTTLNIASSTMRVGDNVTQIVIEARDDTGNLIKTDLALKVVVERGYFETGLPGGVTANDGQRVIQTVMQNGVYSTTFHAGITTGIATIRAYVAGAVAVQSDITLTANDAATIELLSDITELQPEQNERKESFTILVKDDYGNLIDRPFTVKLYTNVGDIMPLLFHAAGDDPLTAILTIPAGTSKRILVWAILEDDTKLMTNYTIEVLGGRRGIVLLPFVSLGQ